MPGEFFTSGLFRSLISHGVARYLRMWRQQLGEVSVMLAIPIIVMNIILFVTRPPDAPAPRTDAPGEHSVILDRGRWVEAASIGPGLNGTLVARDVDGRRLQLEDGRWVYAHN
jgi:hypothetical protein